LHRNGRVQKEKALLRAAVEVTFGVKQSQEETHTVLPTSQKVAIIYQLLCNVSKYLPVDKPRKHQTRRLETSATPQ
jgi:hypothetical protein